jgi:DNA repair protein RecO (recombination protein O)
MPEFRSVLVHAIVLRHSDWGEADRLVSLFTRERGKVRAVVKGARKITSRKGGHLEPFTHVKLQVARGRSDLLIVTQADTIDPFLPLRDSLELAGNASYILEIIERFVYEGEGPNPTLFRILLNTLKRLETEPEPWLPVRYYEMRVLDYLGFRPQLQECANCAREIKAQAQYFSYAAGGAVCPRCGGGLPNMALISVEALKYLRHFQRSSYADAHRARPSEAIKKEIEILLQNYFTYLLERELNSPGFLKNIRGMKK